MARHYHSISIPNELIQNIDTTIANCDLGYTSRTQFVLEAIRARIIELQRNRHRRK